MYSITPAFATRGRQVTWSVYYALFVTGGVFGYIDPSASIARTMTPVGVGTWATFYVLGGLLCLAATVVTHPAAEVVGLPLLAAASALYAAAIFIQAAVSGDPSYVTGGVVLTGQSVHLIDRWLMALKTVRGTVRDDGTT